MLLWTVLATAACAEAPVPPEAGPVVIEPPAEVNSGDDPGAVALAEIERAWLAGEFDLAIGLADSLDREWEARPSVPGDLVIRLARLLRARAEDPRAARILLYHARTLDEDYRGLLRAAAGQMSVGELDGQSRRITSDGKGLGTIRAELAVALARSGDPAGARAVAEQLRDSDLDSVDREKVESVLDGDLAPEAGPVRLGVVVPRTGAFASVGDEIIRGIGLAKERYENEAGRSVELVVIDEAQQSEANGFGVPGLEARGVAGIVGPIRSEALAAAAAARSDPGTLLISPTASEDEGLAPHAYSLWARGRRDVAVSESLANWLTTSLSVGSVAAFHPATESGRLRADTFRTLVEGAGIRWAGAREYEPDSTTFEVGIRELTELDPDVVLVVADGPRQVLQVAPQLHFYGLRGRIALVSEDWTHPTVLRRLDATFLDYRVAATYFSRQDNAEWQTFAAEWDRAYRSSLPENAFAALGYDASLLVLRALADGPFVRPGAVARSVASLGDYQGVTGRFSFETQSRRLVRSTRVRMVLDGRLVDPDPAAIVEWSVDARAREEERVRQEAEEELRRRGGSP